MKSRLNILLFIFILLGVSPLPAQYLSPVPERLSNKQMHADFDQLINILQNCNSQLTVRKKVTGIDQLQLIQNLRPAIDTITRTESFYELMRIALNYTFDVNTKETYTFNPLYDNLKNIDTAYMRYRQKNATPSPPPNVLLGNPICIKHDYFLPGIYQFINLEAGEIDTVDLYYSKIISYNGIPYKKYVQDNLIKFPAGGIRWDYENREYYSLSSSIPLTGMLIVENRGKMMSLNLYHKYKVITNQVDVNSAKPEIPWGNQYKNKVLYLENDQILYIYLDNMIDPQNELPQKIKEIGGNRVIKKVIIDVRGNRGGSDYVWHNVLKAIVGHSLIYNPILAFKNTPLLKKTHKFPNSFFNINKLNIKEFDWLPEGSFLTTNFKPQFLEPDANSLKYKGKIYILQDEKVYSAAHSLTSYARHITQLVSVGEPSGFLGGFGLNPMLFQLKNSKFTFRMETTIDVSHVSDAIDAYQDFPEKRIYIPIYKKLEYIQDQGYDRQCELYLYKYDYLFQRVLELR